MTFGAVESFILWYVGTSRPPCAVYPLLTGPGLVPVDGDKVETLDDFTNLSSQIQKLNSASYSANQSPQSCPSVGSDWQSSNKLPPFLDAELCSCMEESLSCVVRLCQTRK